MLIEWFLSIKSLPNLLFGVLCLPGDQSHPFAQPSINPLACCICWAGLLGRAVFPPWNEGPNFGSYKVNLALTLSQTVIRASLVVPMVKNLPAMQELYCAKSLQSCLTLRHPVDCSPPDSSVHGILQARILETWVQSLGLGRSPGEGNGYPLQYSCLENSMNRGAWQTNKWSITI